MAIGRHLHECRRRVPSQSQLSDGVGVLDDPPNRFWRGKGQNDFTLRKSNPVRANNDVEPLRRVLEHGAGFGTEPDLPPDILTDSREQVGCIGVERTCMRQSDSIDRGDQRFVLRLSCLGFFCSVGLNLFQKTIALSRWHEDRGSNLFFVCG